MDGDTSSVICSFRLELDVRVGVYDPQEQLRVNVLCISELHYCKSIVGVLQALCFLLTVTVKWLYYGVVTPTMPVTLSKAHICQKCSICRLHAEVIVLQVTQGWCHSYQHTGSPIPV